MNGEARGYQITARGRHGKASHDGFLGNDDISLRIDPGVIAVEGSILL
jgi:hypothetical protein